MAKTTKPAAKTTATKKTAAKTAAKPAVKAKKQGFVSQENIRQRAYEIYVSRNGKPGDPYQDWLQAEKELAVK